MMNSNPYSSAQRLAPWQDSAGKERDAESGLDYFGVRYCSAAQGRFTSIDPVAMSRDKIKDSQLLNMYAYTRNNPLRYIDPTGEEVRLADLSDEDRKRLLEELQKQTGLLLRYNAKSGNLEITGRGEGGSKTYREELTRLIDDKNVFNVLNRSEYAGRIDFGRYDSRARNIVIDFKDFSPTRPEINLGLVFYHEAIAHGLNNLPDDSLNPFGGLASPATGLIARELGLAQPACHNAELRNDRYYIRVVNEAAPQGTFKGWLQDHYLLSQDTRLVDVTDVVKEK
jgi:RHS repeat-associated protein